MCVNFIFCQFAMRHHYIRSIFIADCIIFLASLINLHYLHCLIIDLEKNVLFDTVQCYIIYRLCLYHIYMYVFLKLQKVKILNKILNLRKKLF